MPFPGGAVTRGVPDDQGRELVAAQPGRRVALPDRVLESAGGLDEQFVPGLVPDGVVDALEAVEVDEEDGRVAQGDAAVGGPTAGQGLLDAPGEQRPVGQVGERIVLGVVLELRLQAHSLGHVPAVEDEAAVVTVDGGLDVEPAALAGAEAAFDACGGFLQGAGGEEAAHLVHHAAQVLRVDEGGQFRTHQVLGGTAVDPGGGRGDVPEDAAGGGDHDDVARTLHQGAEVVLLLRQFLGEGDVVEQHDALAHHEGEHDGAAGDEHDAVDAAAVQDVVEDPQRADGGGEVGGECGQRPGDRPVGRIPAVITSRRGGLVVAPGALPGDVLVHHARVPGAVPVAVLLPAPGRGPRRVRQEQRACEPARVEQLAGAVAVVQQRRGEQRVAHHGQRERADRGVDRGAVRRGAPEVQREHHADQGDVEQRVRERERGVRHALPAAGVDLGGLGEGQTPRQCQQRAADQPGVQSEADPAGLRDGSLGEHQEPHDGGRREAEEEPVGVGGAGHGPLQNDLIPPPDQVAEGRHRRGEREQQPGGSKADTAATGVAQAGHGGGGGRGGQPEVAHDQRESVRTPAERGTGGVRRAHQGENELRHDSRAAVGGRQSRQRRRLRGLGPRRRVQGGGGRQRAHRALPVRAAPGSRGSGCVGCACRLRVLCLRWRWL